MAGSEDNYAETRIGDIVRGTSYNRTASPGPSEDLKDVKQKSKEVVKPKTPSKEKKIGHRRVDSNGSITYKRINTSEIIASIQLGIEKSVGHMDENPDRDVLMNDFMTVESTSFIVPDDYNTTFSKPHFIFKTYAPTAFRHFRDLFHIKPDYFVSSFCSRPLSELSNPGASGSVLYLTHDDQFITKTVQRREALFLQKLLPGYYLNLNQNKNTLLPKFFGLYCFKCGSKRVRLVAMNNVLTSSVEIHQKFDLKGSTYNRKASDEEKLKKDPTLKDLDFLDLHPEGISLEGDDYRKLVKTVLRDCRVLESFQIIDYSLLLGIHNLDQAKQESAQHEQEGGKELSQNSVSGDGRTEHHSDERHFRVFSDELSEPSSSIKDPVNHKTLFVGGIPAKQANGNNLLIFIGIIDILQSYVLKKKVEHVWKSVLHDGKSVSVHNPEFYAQRFQNFLVNKVFKAMPSSCKGKRKCSPIMKREEKEH